MNMEKRRLTIKDIASACNVSIATVSYVLNDRAEEHISEQTRNRILHYVNLHGYETSVAARALATGQNHAVGIYAPRAHEVGDRACATLLFLNALSGALEAKGLRTLLLTSQCLKQRSRHVDAIVAVNLPRDEFYTLGQANFCPLLCVDGCMDDLMLFYQIYDDFYAIASHAREISGKERLFFLHDAYLDEGIERRVADAFDEVCASDDPALSERAAMQGENTAFVAMGYSNYIRLRALGIMPLCVLYEGEAAPEGAWERTIFLPTTKKAETVAGLVENTIKRQSPEEHDIRIF